uniref:Ovule protein n=1 Tax=Romanomermis culicivorax TaxID=13658 RepID=A0A915LES7_ROMCU
MYKLYKWNIDYRLYVYKWVMYKKTLLMSRCLLGNLIDFLAFPTSFLSLHNFVRLTCRQPLTLEKRQNQEIIE